MSEQRQDTAKLNVRHYITQSIFQKYENTLQINDIGIIGNKMCLYATDVIDEKLTTAIQKAHREVQEVEEKLTTALGGVTATAAVELLSLSNNVYKKAESDERFQPKGTYVTEIPQDYVRESRLREYVTKYSQSYTYDKSNLYTKVEGDDRYVLLNDLNTGVILDEISAKYSAFKVHLNEYVNKCIKNLAYIKLDMDSFLSLKADKGNVYTKEEADMRYLNKTEKPDVSVFYTKGESDNRFAKVEESTIILPNGIKIEIIKEAAEST